MVFGGPQFKHLHQYSLSPSKLPNRPNEEINCCLFHHQYHVSTHANGSTAKTNLMTASFSKNIWWPPNQSAIQTSICIHGRSDRDEFAHNWDQFESTKAQRNGGQLSKGVLEGLSTFDGCSQIKFLQHSLLSLWFGEAWPPNWWRCS